MLIDPKEYFYVKHGAGYWQYVWKKVVLADAIWLTFGTAVVVGFLFFPGTPTLQPTTDTLCLTASGQI